MTGAYDDIEAVTKVLEEKEQDLELTVQIGKELLAHNKALGMKITKLEADLQACSDEKYQLVHDLQKKTKLIEILTCDACNGCETDSSPNVDYLQRKISFLQDENKGLKVERMKLIAENDELEEHERELMLDINRKINESNCQYNRLKLELEQQRKENQIQHDKIVLLSAKLSDTEIRLHQMSNANEEHITLLNATNESQKSLELELSELRLRYEEVLSLLHETQDKMRQQQKKLTPHARSTFVAASGCFHPESLHSELMELSLYSDNRLDPCFSGDSHRIDDAMAHPESSTPNSSVLATEKPYIWCRQIFETVECVNNQHQGDKRNAAFRQFRSDSFNSDSFSCSTLKSTTDNRPDDCLDGNEVSKPEDADISSLSQQSSSQSQSNDAYASQSSGVPGAPGANDLKTALRRLQSSEVFSSNFMMHDDNQNSMKPLVIETPEGVSTKTSGFFSTTNDMCSSGSQCHLPLKLQIVKPIEGSQTLNHWSKLAMTSLADILDERPGVTIRGGRGLSELGIQIYTLSDVEEDASEELPRKKFDCSCTYATSLVMHPKEIFIKHPPFRFQTHPSSADAENLTSRSSSSCPSTPTTVLSCKNTCRTISINGCAAKTLDKHESPATKPCILANISDHAKHTNHSPVSPPTHKKEKNCNVR